MEEPAAVPDRLIVSARRKDLKISYEKLAEHLSGLCGVKIKWQSVQQFESGKNKNPRFLWQLAKALDTTDEYLSGRTTDPKANDQLTKNLIDSPKAKRGPAEWEGNMLLGKALEDIGMLGERLRVMEARLAELERAAPGATAKGPHRGTRGR
jgi:transcriptional regulator with XRE-family HTH domain